MAQLQGLIGIVVLLGLAALLSENRKRFPLKLAISGRLSGSLPTNRGSAVVDNLRSMTNNNRSRYHVDLYTVLYQTLSRIMSDS